MVWPLEQAMADGTLQLPTGRNGDVRKLSGSAVNCYIHRKSRSTGKPKRLNVIPDLASPMPRLERHAALIGMSSLMQASNVDHFPRSFNPKPNATGETSRPWDCADFRDPPKPRNQPDQSLQAEVSSSPSI